MREKSVILVFFALIYSLNAQKKLEKVIPLNDIAFFQINSENCYKVKLRTHNINEIFVKAYIEGEYQNDIIIVTTQQITTLFIGAEFQVLFENPNDKLSAHKVISISLDIVIPKWMSVKLLGGSTSINLSGQYNKIEVYSMDKNVVLQRVEGNVFVQSFSGDVILNIESGKVDANSKFGHVYSNDILKGDSNFIVNTVNGSIYINKEE